jgi:hypothetical protein
MFGKSVQSPGLETARRMANLPLRRSLSLRWTLAIVVALLALAPNVVMALIYLLPLAGEDSSRWSLYMAWLLAIALVSILVGYAVSTLLLQPLTRLANAVCGRPSRAPWMPCVPSRQNAARSWQPWCMT